MALRITKTAVSKTEAQLGCATERVYTQEMQRLIHTLFRPDVTKTGEEEGHELALP